MIGECTGKVRSTPTPKLTFRTVNVSRLPLPLRRITMPWKTCTRSRLPSTTRTCTFRVSPGANSGMSSRSWVRSTRSVAFIGSSGIEEPAMLPAGSIVRELAQERLLLRGERHRGDEVGASGDGPPQRGRPPPPVDPGVVATQQHLGHPVTPELGGPRVLRVLEARGHERLVVPRRRVAHDPGEEARHRV